MRLHMFLTTAALVCGLLPRPLLPQAAIVNGPPPALLAPAADRDGQIVVFGAGVDPDGTIENSLDLWLWNEAGTPIRLTNYASAGRPSAVTSYALSEDGAQVAYVLSNNGGSPEEIHVMNIASGEDRLIATDKQGCVQPLVDCPGCFFPCVHDPHFTADGSVLYVASRSQPFYLATTAGTVTSLPIYTGYLTSGPRRAISDTGLVVFISSAPTGPVTGPGTMDVYVMNLDGSGLKNLTQFSNTSAYTAGAAISADGSTVAFNASLDGTVPLQIFVVNPDSAGLRQLTNGPNAAGNPSLSADGSLVAFAQSGQIQVLQTSGGHPAATLTSFHYSTAQDAFLSDDGTQVCFTIGPSGGRGAIYAAPAAGGASRALYAPVSLNAGGVEGVAGWEPPTPGSLISAYGLNFSGDELVEAASFPLPPALANVSLLVNGQAVPVEAVTPWQINAQLPQSTPPGNVTFQLVVNGIPHNTVTLQVPASGPSVFAFGDQDLSGNIYWQAAAFHAGTGTPADAAHPAKAGEILESYGSGLGVTNPVVLAGQPSPGSPPARAVVTPQATIGTQPGQITFAGLVPGFAGVYQINLAVPDGLTTGQQSLNWTIDNRGASIFVQ